MYKNYFMADLVSSDLKQISRRSTVDPHGK
jgi:hypothetical protein